LVGLEHVFWCHECCLAQSTSWVFHRLDNQSHYCISVWSATRSEGILRQPWWEEQAWALNYKSLPLKLALFRTLHSIVLTEKLQLQLVLQLFLIKCNTRLQVVLHWMQGIVCSVY
jgi:hypothetical protein